MGRQTTGINICPRFTLSNWTSTSVLTLDIAHWIRCGTPIGKFRIETVVGDAFRYGFNLKDQESKLPRWALPIFTDAVKYSETFGYAGTYHASGLVNQVEALPPNFAQSRGGIGAFNEDERGMPQTWEYYNSTGTKSEPFPMATLNLFSALKCDRDYRGHSVFEPVADDIMFLQKWRMASGVRAKEYANAGKIIVKEGPFTAEDKTELGKIYPNAKMFTLGTKDAEKVQILDVGGLLTDSEQLLTIDGLKEMIACGFGVTKSDITGANAGEKLGADFNQSSYFMTLEGIQRNYAENAYKFFELLPGLGTLDDDFPFKAPREIPLADRVQTLTDIAMSYLNLAGQGKPGVDPKTGETTPGDPAMQAAGASMAQVMQELFFVQAKMM
jgi:hypothetical protein